MSSESELLLEIWGNFRDLIPASKREEAALLLLRSFEEYGYDIEPSEVEGEDSVLDQALVSFREDPEEDEEEE